MNRALVMMDISGLGRCALGVALPTLCAMGVQAVPLPMGVLSAHTGGFGQVARADLTDFAAQSLAHYESLGTAFQAIYAGYLLSDDQIPLLARALTANPGAFSLIDPVMGDYGKYYTSIAPSRAAAYRKLCPLADLITPNHTEAHLLLDAAQPLPHEALLCGLLELGCRSALVKGVPMPGGGAANVYRSREDKAPLVVPYAPEPGAYPGTGDLFASILLGALLRGESPEDAISRAANFVRDAIALTNSQGTAPKEGVAFEAIVHTLANEVGTKCKFPS